MISEESMRNIDTAFHKVVRASLVRDAGDVCEIVTAERGVVGSYAGDKMLLITIASFVFRLIIIFRIAENPATRAYYVRGEGDQTLDEVFAETANMCVGALNRELSVNFPHLAMSTPHILSSKCIAFLGELKPQYISSHLITINDAVKLQATLCMCCSAPVEVAGRVAGNESEDESRVSELELF
jgi:hypothetical protein